MSLKHLLNNLPSSQALHLYTAMMRHILKEAHSGKKFTEYLIYAKNNFARYSEIAQEVAELLRKEDIKVSVGPLELESLIVLHFNWE